MVTVGQVPERQSSVADDGMTVKPSLKAERLETEQPLVIETPRQT